MRKADKITVYAATKGKGVRAILGEIIEELPQAHQLGIRLFKRNVKALYRKSMLGFAWALLPPLVTAMLWVFLYHNGVIQPHVGDMPYGIFVVCGTLLWQIFSEGVFMPLRVVQDNQSILVKINIPREGLLLSGIYEMLLNMVIRALVLTLLLLLFGGSLLHMGILWAMISMIVIAVAGFSCGLLLTPLGLLYQDIVRILNIGMPFLMYLTPVVYAVPSSGTLGSLMRFNPLAPLITTGRQWLVGIPPTTLGAFWISTAFFLALFFFGLLLYRRSLQRIIERMGA